MEVPVKLGLARSCVGVCAKTEGMVAKKMAMNDVGKNILRGLRK